MNIFARNIISKIIVVQVLTLVCINTSMSQEGPYLSTLEKGRYDGYVVIQKGDTIRGEFIVPKRHIQMYSQIDFVDVSDAHYSFSPTDLKCFVIRGKFFLGNTKVYVDELPYYRYLFLERLSNGYVKLYRYENKQVKFVSSSKITRFLPSSQYKFIEVFVSSYGYLKPNTVISTKSLANYTYDNEEISNKIRTEKLKTNDLVDLILNYNSWLPKTDSYNLKCEIDSINSSTKKDLLQAQYDSVLFLQFSDRNMYEYMFRIIYNAYNALNFMDYVITDKRNRHNLSLEIGLHVSTTDSYNKIGTWQYFYPSKDGELPRIKKQESYDIYGLLHGTLVEYDKKGNIKDLANYSHGRRNEP